MTKLKLKGETMKNIAKKALLLLSIVVMGTTAINAKQMSTDELEKFFYNKGYADAKNTHYEKGYADGLSYAEAKLKEYTTKIKAYEMGKYLMSKNKISYPKVYQTLDANGNVRVVIDGCKIQSELSTADITMMPKAPSSHLGTMESRGNHYVDQKEGKQVVDPITDKVFLAGIDDGSLGGETPTLGGADIKMVYKYFPQTNFYETLLRKTNKVYAVENGKLKVIFSSRSEADAFCRRHHLKNGKDCL